MNESDLEQQSDWALLDRYSAAGSEEAFSALVHRHLNLVYAVALRHCGDAGMAEEVANNVFCILARKARTLKKNVAVPGWLFKTARYAASNARKFQSRRQEWEREATGSDGCFLQEDSSTGEGELAKAWELIARQLDQAVAELNEADRNAILLRFYESKSLREIGIEFGISEEAARKRTARALEKLRASMAGRRVVCSAATLGLALATYSAQSAPAGMAATIAQAAGNLPTEMSGRPDPVPARSIPELRWRLLKFAALSIIAGGLLYGGARSYLGSGGPGLREVFLRQMQAVQSGDGEAYAQTILFNDAEKRQTRPVFVDSVRVQFNLRTNLVHRFGEGAFSQSRFPAFLDVVDTNRVREAVESIQNERGTLVLPWGSRLPFVRERGDWKLDYFTLPGVPPAARYQLNTAQRNRVIETFTREIEAGSFADIQEAYNSLQQQLRRRSR